MCYVCVELIFKHVNVHKNVLVINSEVEFYNCLLSCFITIRWMCAAKYEILKHCTSEHAKHFEISISVKKKKNILPKTVQIFISHHQETVL